MIILFDNKREDAVMNITDASHEMFVKLFADKKQKEMIRNSSKTFIRFFEEIVKNDKMDDKEKSFLLAILTEAKSNFYVQFNLQEKAFLLYKRNFKGVMIIGHNRPGAQFEDYFKGHEYVIELTHIHSVQKGEGHKMIKRLLHLKKKLKSPVVLWTETKENVLYFEKYGFENKGRLGDKKEFLMILSEIK